MRPPLRAARRLVYLANEFPRLSLAEIRRIFVANAHRLAPTHRALQRWATSAHQWPALNIRPLRVARRAEPVPVGEDAEFDAEVAFLQRQAREALAEKDEAMAREVNAAMYTQCGQCIDCAVCFTPTPFEEARAARNARTRAGADPCCAAHSWCSAPTRICCVCTACGSTWPRAWVRLLVPGPPAAADGGGARPADRRLVITCPCAEGCNARVLDSQLHRALPPTLWRGLELMRAEEDIAMAKAPPPRAAAPPLTAAAVAAQPGDVPVLPVRGGGASYCARHVPLPQPGVRAAVVPPLRPGGARAAAV
jgi:hypothetical protein